jgi:hypothetical protein
MVLKSVRIESDFFLGKSVKKFCWLRKNSYLCTTLDNRGYLEVEKRRVKYFRKKVLKYLVE